MSSGIQYSGPADAEYVGTRETQSMLTAWRQAGRHMTASPVLGARLRECTELVMQVSDRPVEAILGSIDSLKFRSSMTLFAQITKAGDVFAGALERFFGGQPDELTLRQL